MIKILLADDQPLLLSALETILGAQSDLTVAATAANVTSPQPEAVRAWAAARRVEPVVTTSSTTNTRSGRRVDKARNRGPARRAARERPV